MVKIYRGCLLCHSIANSTGVSFSNGCSTDRPLSASSIDHIHYVTGIGNISREQYVAVVQSMSP